jgi:hypothetical protein
LLGQQRECRMVGRKLEFGGDACLCLALPHQPGVGTHAQRQAQTIQQDRLAGAGLAGQHTEAWLELQLEPVDQHHIADRQLPQHGLPPRRISSWAGQQPL